MCTAICATNKNFYFGRNLDYEHTFGEKVTVTPRFFPFSFLNGKELKKHYAVIGMASIFGARKIILLANGASRKRH